MSAINILDTILAKAKLSKKETLKQQKIVETAIKMFAEKGYANTSTSEIAKESGVAEGTIFRHYGTKENLLLSVILPFLKELPPVIAKEFLDQVRLEEFDTFESFLKALIKNRLNFIKENREIFQIVVKEFLYREELRNELVPHIKKEVLGFLNSALDRFKAQGEIIDIPNERLIRLLLGAIGSYFISRFILLSEESDHDDGEEIDNLIRFIVKGLKP